MIMDIFMGLIYIILTIVAIVALIAVAGGVTFGLIFGEIAIWVLRIILIIIIGKLLWNFIFK